MEAVEGGGVAPVLEFLVFGAIEPGVAPSKGGIVQYFVAWHYVAATFGQTVAPDSEVLVVGRQSDLGLHIGEDQRRIRRDFLPAGRKACQKKHQQYESVFFHFCNRQGGQALTAKGLKWYGDINFITPFGNISIELDSTADDRLTLITISISITIDI